MFQFSPKEDKMQQKSLKSWGFLSHFTNFFAVDLILSAREANCSEAELNLTQG